MAKNIRISDTLYALAQAEARLQQRSLAQQVEFWAKLGMAAEGSVGRVGAAEAQREATRRKDALDVVEGRRDASYLHFLPSSMVRDSKPRFSDDYEAG
jgi:hypothetical protein